MRIGVLQTDFVLPELQSRFGDYPTMIERVLRQSASGPLDIAAIDVQRPPLPEPTDFDGYVITGSRASVYDELQWLPPLVDFVRAAAAARRRVVGLCFGHQLLAHFFGGRVGPAERGWAVGVHRSAVLRQMPWMDPPLEHVSLLSSHKDQVLSLPADALLIATNPVCPVAGFVLGEHLLALQGHPEFQKPYAEALMRRRESLLGPETFQRGLSSLAEPTHEGEVARWILNFIAAGDCR